VNISCTLDELFGGGSIQTNDKLFDNWALERNIGSIEPDLSQIDVVGLDNGGTNSGSGLKYNANGELFVDFFDFIDLAFNYQVSVLNPSMMIVGNSLEILTYDATDDGFITVDETVFDQSFFSLGTKHVEIDPYFGTIDLFDELEFDEQSLLIIEKEIYIDAFSGSAELIMFEQRFSQVPEPETLVLFGISLASLGFVRWRRRVANDAV
jgi:hypothetical protein